MKTPWLKLTFLVVVLVATSGYRFRCYWACVDQTGVQNDYVEQRDRCRQYAQLKLDMAMRNSGVENTEQNRKPQLITLFSECMGQNGWTIPDARSELKAATAAAGPAQPGQPQPPYAASAAPVPATASAAAAATVAANERASISRTAECAFARQSADVSSIAASRAKACDLECAQRLKAAPDAPRPAACSPEPTPDLAKGVDRP